jgi:hypothetical protein
MSQLPDHTRILAITIIACTVMTLLIYYVVIRSIRFSITHELILQVIAVKPTLSV